MLVRVGCEIEYETAQRTPSLWQVRPRSNLEQQVVTETWEPPASVRTYFDAYGNACERLSLPVGQSVLRYDAIVEVTSDFDGADKGAAAVAIEDLPDEAFVYLLPSRFCWPDMLHDPAWDLFESVEPG